MDIILTKGKFNFLAVNPDLCDLIFLYGKSVCVVFYANDLGPSKINSNTIDVGPYYQIRLTPYRTFVWNGKWKQGSNGSVYINLNQKGKKEDNLKGFKSKLKNFMDEFDKKRGVALARLIPPVQKPILV